MKINLRHSTRFLAAGLGLAWIFTLAGCAGTPEEPEVVEEPEEVVTTPAEEEEQPLVLKAHYPERYVVVKGDTLWDISARFLKDPWYWPKLWHYNPHIENPHLIYPGDILSIVFIDGRPMMQLERNGQVLTTPLPAGEKQVSEGEPTRRGDGTALLPKEVKGQQYPTVRLSPRIREADLDQAIPTIPLDIIGPFLNRPRVVREDELENAPYVVANTDGRIMAGSGYKIYARELDENDLYGDYVIVRRGAEYEDPESGDTLGYEAIYLGEARLTRFGDPSTLRVTDSEKEILRGDRLIPRGDELISHSFMPRSPEQKVDGQIIAAIDTGSLIGQFKVVVLNLGRQEDIEPGHVLAINQKGDRVEDIVEGGSVTLPTERVGTVMVFRVFDRVSYALIMDSTKIIKLFDHVNNP